MLNKKIARRYAKALFEIAKEQDQIDRFGKELAGFVDLLTAAPDLARCLLSPLYSAPDLKKIITALLQKMAVSKTVEDFLCLLVDKRRMLHLRGIIETYENLTNEALGYAKAKITTAVTLAPQDYDHIKDSLEKITRKKILLTSVVDPHVIGGVVAEVGDTVFDGSIRSHLQKMRETLIYRG